MALFSFVGYRKVGLDKMMSFQRKGKKCPTIFTYRLIKSHEEPIAYGTIADEREDDFWRLRWVGDLIEYIKLIKQRN